MKWILIAVAALLGFGSGRAIKGGGVDGDGAQPSSALAVTALESKVEVPQRFTDALAVRGARQLPAMHDALLSATTSSELKSFAQRLLTNEANATSESLWAILFARWSEVDPAVMIAFADAQRGHMLGAEMQRLAFLAWGAVDPDGAFEGVRYRSKTLRNAVLDGIVATDPTLAAEIALKMPDGQFALRRVVKEGVLDEGALRELMESTIYDGARIPVQDAIIRELAGEDPVAALEFARSAGSITGHEPVAEAFAEIARQNPAAATDLFPQLPASRQRAMSAVSLAKAWAAKDSDAALSWARDSLEGPVRATALVEVASVIGGADPLAGLALVEESGWEDAGKFYRVVGVDLDGNGGVLGDAAQPNVTALAVARALLGQLATVDAAAAQGFVSTADASVRDELAEALAEP